MDRTTKVTITDTNEGYAQELQARDHTFWADEPHSLEGLDSGPTPVELFLASLGSCASITIRMYARKKQWPLKQVQITMILHHEEAGDRIEKQIQVRGELTDEQKARLLEIADRCPVHKLATGHPQIDSHLVE